MSKFYYNICRKGQRNIEKHSMFAIVWPLAAKLGGGVDIHVIWKGMSGQACVHGGEGALPPPLEIGKTGAVRGNSNLLHLD